MKRARRGNVLQEAEIWVAYGKPAMAIGMLEWELQLDSTREDIRQRIKELKITASDQSISRSALLKHQLVAWGCVILSFSAAFGPLLAFLKLAPEMEVVQFDELIAHSIADHPFSLLLLVLAAFLVICVVPLLVSGYIHMYIWFRYLSTLPVQTRKQ